MLMRLGRLLLSCSILFLIAVPLHAGIIYTVETTGGDSVPPIKLSHEFTDYLTTDYLFTLSDLIVDPMIAIGLGPSELTDVQLLVIPGALNDQFEVLGCTGYSTPGAPQHCLLPPALPLPMLIPNRSPGTATSVARQSVVTAGGKFLIQTFNDTLTLTITDTNAIPEPSALVLAGIAGAGILLLRRRRA